MLGLPLGLVGREIGLGLLGTCFSGWVCLVLFPCFCCVEIWVGVSRRTCSFPVSDGGLVHGTSDQCVSFSLIDAKDILPPA